MEEALSEEEEVAQEDAGEDLAVVVLVEEAEEVGGKHFKKTLFFYIQNVINVNNEFITLYNDNTIILLVLMLITMHKSNRN